MAKVKLDERSVKKLGPKQAEDGRLVNVVYWDLEVPGFGLQVTKAGSRSWVLKYKAGRLQDWYVFGTFPGLTVAAARARALDLKDQVRRGINPRDQVRAQRNAITVHELADRALAEHWASRSDRMQEDVKGMLDQWIKPKLGRKLVKDVTDADVTKLLHAMRETPIRANRALACLSMMFALAEKWGDRAKGTNPAHGQERNPEHKRKRYLLPEELPWFAAGLKAEEHRFPMGVQALRLALFTGLRRGELLNLQWTWIDLQTGAIRIPPEAHKTGRKTGEKLVPLNGTALGLLSTLAKNGRLGPYVFPSPSDLKAPMEGLRYSWSAVLEAAREAARKDAKARGVTLPAGFLEDIRIHDLRHSFASYVVSGGTSLPVVGALLGHTQAATTQRYAHLLDDPLRLASQAADDAMRTAMGGRG